MLAFVRATLPYKNLRMWGVWVLAIIEAPSVSSFVST